MLCNILILCTCCRKFLTYKGISVIMLLVSFVLLVYCTFCWDYYIVNHGAEVFSLKLNPNTWTGISYEINFKINSLSFLFIFLVSIIGFATNVYIFNYFKSEERAEEFVLLINWFILSMIVLVSGNNFFTIILGWELIGLTSFLLINFWKYKVTTLGCSFKAFSFNKFSDLFLMISFCTLWNAYKVSNVDTLLTLISFNKIYSNNMLTFSAVCLLICSSIKSAQIFGHLWLPDSMEAPVPASSLIHSATLVSAGIYLILKFQIIFIITQLMGVIFVLGSITACYGGIVAASQTDVKKLLAYSTISHCGFIFTTISLNNFTITIIYLYLHGLFKALTFFCVGSLIKYNNTQDMRLMGMNKSQIINTMTLILASINLGGLPFTFGSLYKQTYLLYLINSHFNIIGHGLCIIGMLSSLVYVYKLIYYSCFDFRKGILQTTILYLQNYKLLWKDLSVNFTYAKLVAFFIIFVYSIMFYLIVKLYIFKIYSYIFYQPLTSVNEIKYLSNLFFFKNYLISIYYVFFTTLIIVLIINSNRTNYFYLQKITLLQQILLIVFTLSIVRTTIGYTLIYYAYGYTDMICTIESNVESMIYTTKQMIGLAVLIPKCILYSIMYITKQMIGLAVLIPKCILYSIMYITKQMIGLAVLITKYILFSIVYTTKQMICLVVLIIKYTLMLIMYPIYCVASITIKYTFFLIAYLLHWVITTTNDTLLSILDILLDTIFFIVYILKIAYFSVLPIDRKLFAILIAMLYFYIFFKFI